MNHRPSAVRSFVPPVAFVASAASVASLVAPIASGAPVARRALVGVLAAVRVLAAIVIALVAPVPAAYAQAPDLVQPSDADAAADPARNARGEAADSAASASETWHVSTYVSGPMGFRVIDYWSKGPWMRANTLVSGHPLTTIVHGERYVVFDAIRGEGLSIRRSPRALAGDATRGRPFGNDLAELVAQGGEKVEDLRFRGEDATVWRLTSDATRRTVWVRRRKEDLPMRVEIFERASAQTVTIDYANWIRGIEIDESFFEAPAQVSLRRLDYDAYLESAQSGDAGPFPVLYPDLLHGGEVR